MYPYINKKFRSGDDPAENVETNREDVLTAMVFGAMRYLPEQVFLQPVLREMGIPVEDTEDRAEVQFWPRWTEEEPEEDTERAYVEPDWQITWSGKKIIGESKLGAPLDASQLHREWNAAQENTPSEQDLYLVAVTPRIQDRDVVKQHEDWYWISWQRISLILQDQVSAQKQNQRRLTEDLVDALERFGISPLHVLSGQGDVPPVSEFEIPFAGARTRQSRKSAMSRSLASLDRLPDVPSLNFFNHIREKP